ncbi:MAG: Lpg1974 family pore-forming outer membrane protein [Chlamydiales bacterium]|nr:Lpg1974 family pore-forming outer membrane protein [Chlamydiales bacterium]
MPWLVASILVATSIFGDAKELAADSNNCRPKPVEQKPCPQPKPCPPKPCCEPVPQIQLMPAYNAPARIDVRGSWDLIVGASFIYWEAMQDDMDFAASVVSNNVTSFSLTPGAKTTAKVIGHDFSYEPGFKILAGMNFDHDHWEGFAEYTWFSSKTNTSASKETVSSGEYSTIQPTKGNPGIVGNDGFNSATQQWNLSYQALNTVLARTYYVGKNLTFRSMFGPRFAWFSQTKELAFLGSTGASTGTNPSNLVNANFDEKANFSSWGAGLVAGLDTNWIIGEGFRLIGNGSFDILYTRVQTSNDKETYALNTAPASPTIFAFQTNRPDFLMPHANLEFGFGWGSYFDCNNWHIDLFATYCFQTFWGANLFHESYDNVQPANGRLSDANLYMHGLTTGLRLDF